MPQTIPFDKSWSHLKKKLSLAEKVMIKGVCLKYKDVVSVRIRDVIQVYCGQTGSDHRPDKPPLLFNLLQNKGNQYTPAKKSTEKKR